MHTVTEYDMIFDDVQFGIDVRQRRESAGMSQNELAAILGYTTGGMISKIETASYSQFLNMRDFLKLCNRLELSPAEYFDMELGGGAEIFSGWEV